jgi:hypothetical protein
LEARSCAPFQRASAAQATAHYRNRRRGYGLGLRVAPYDEGRRRRHATGRRGGSPAGGERIASEFGLPDDWLNQKAVEADKIVIPQPPGRTVFETATLALEVPSLEHMLAMKVARFAGDTDIGDATILLQNMRLRFSDVEDVWTQIGGFVPVAKRDAAHYYLLKLWEDLDESA